MNPLLAGIDPYILAFSAVTVIVTIWMGFRSAKTSKTASDFFVAERSVSVGWNASAISGEYLSAASFMGVAGMVMSSGYDALWYPVCYACGYLFLLLFIAGPLRRFGAYTIPDFAEGRFDSPLFRKIAVVFVLFIGFFYTMPQMKGAGTTLAYIFPGLPYWAGVVLVGAVITLNVALGGMKGITLVQAFQYWIKMFAISVPIFVLMAVYGHYGAQLGAQGKPIGFQMPGMNISANETNISVRGEIGTGSLTNKLNVDGSLTNVAVSFVDVLTKIANAPLADRIATMREELPEKAPTDATWLNPFGPLTTKAAKAAPGTLSYNGPWTTNSVQNAYSSVTAYTAKDKLSGINTQVGSTGQISASLLLMNYAYFLARAEPLNFGERMTLLYTPKVEAVQVNWPGFPQTAYRGVAGTILTTLETNGVVVVREGRDTFKAFTRKEATITPIDPRPYSLLYTYSLIIAIVCGTAGLPHILVRFYTNPDGVAAKRTTMWVMILIGVFYVFPPVFGVIGRNLLPELYSGVGAKGTDKIVLELPRIISERYGVLGSILSGITCAGAFAAFMSTFSGLLVSMTGALAHDVYGRMLNPKASAEQRMKMFKWCAVLIGGVAVLLGSQVEPLQINFMVGQAFAIAAASYFPLLFMAVWWRKLTMKGAATGMLTGGMLALAGISLTSFTDLKWLPLDAFWAAHPLLRILCEQPAIWAVPLAIILMVIVSKLTSKDVPEDIRMKMLVLHAPEKLGLKQEYIQEHQAGH